MECSPEEAAQKTAQRVATSQHKHKHNHDKRCSLYTRAAGVSGVKSGYCDMCASALWLFSMIALFVVNASTEMTVFDAIGDHTDVP